MPSIDASALLTIVGSGTLIPNANRGSAAHHLQTDGASLLMDCGSGTLHGLAAHGVEWESLTHVAISHFHTDHVGDLAALLWAFKHGTAVPRTTPLTLLGPRGFRTLLEGLADALGQHVLDPGFDVTVLELDEDGVFAAPGGAFTLRCFPTPHSDESVALAVAGPWGSLGYTGDTGPSSEVARFLSGSGVLVAECTLADPPPRAGHLSPHAVAEMASVVRPDLLVVTHVFPPQTPSEAVEKVSERYAGRVVAAVDGLRVRIESGHVTVDLPEGPVYT